MGYRIVSIAGFPPGSNEEDVRQIISPRKRNKWPIADIQFNPLSNRVLVMFENNQHAIDCMRAINNTEGYSADWATQVGSVPEKPPPQSRSLLLAQTEKSSSAPRIVLNQDAQNAVRTVFLRGFPRGTNRWEIQQKASAYGTVTGLRVLHDGATAFVDFAEAESARECIDKLFAQTGFTARWARDGAAPVSQSSSSSSSSGKREKQIGSLASGLRTTVFLAGFPLGTTRLNVVKKCIAYGKLNDVRVIDKGACAFADFSDHPSAAKCIEQIFSDTGIQAEWSKGPMFPEPTFKRIQPPLKRLIKGDYGNKDTTKGQVAQPDEQENASKSDHAHEDIVNGQAVPLANPSKPPEPLAYANGPDYRKLLEEQEKVTEKYRLLLEENEKIFQISKQRWAEERQELLERLAQKNRSPVDGGGETAWLKERWQLLEKVELGEQAQHDLKVIKSHLGAVDVRFEEVLEILRGYNLD